MTNNIIISNKVYDVKEAAEVLGATPVTIAEYCHAGKIKCKKIGKWRILGQSLIDFLRSDPPTK